MNIDGPIKTFAEFNNDNCRNGYLYFNQRDDLRISVMPSKRILDTSWSLQKIPFKQTSRILNRPISKLLFFLFLVHFLCYHVESKVKFLRNKGVNYNHLFLVICSNNKYK